MTRIRAHLAPVLFALLSAACRSGGEALEPGGAPPALSTELSNEDLTLGPNDVLRVGVYGHPELSALPHANTASGTRVDREGNLSLPLVGPVRVAGLTMSEAREAITAAFAVYLQDPKVDVSVVEYGARRFYVFGEVETPGAFVLDRPLSIYQGLSLAGGFTPQARRKEIVLLRGEPGAPELHVFDAERASRSGLFALRPDDLIFVRRSGAGRFSQEFLPILQGISASLGSIATLILIDDRLGE
jgi:polysaccharide export outer membrane protein